MCARTLCLERLPAELATYDADRAVIEFAEQFSADVTMTGPPRADVLVRHFPGFGRRWLIPLGPFNEHLAKDVGAMFLALGTLSAVALTAADNDAVVRLTAATWLTFNIFHFAYHMQMLHIYGAVDKTLNVITLSLLLVVSAGLLARIRS